MYISKNSQSLKSPICLEVIHSKNFYSSFFCMSLVLKFSNLNIMKDLIQKFDLEHQYAFCLPQALCYCLRLQCLWYEKDHTVVGFSKSRPFQQYCNSHVMQELSFTMISTKIHQEIMTVHKSLPQLLQILPKGTTQNNCLSMVFLPSRLIALQALIII